MVVRHNSCSKARNIILFFEEPKWATRSDLCGGPDCTQSWGELIFGRCSEGKGVKVDLVSSPPALHSGPHVFPLSTEVPRLFTLPLMLETQEGRACYTSVASADLWHRRLGHCNSRALLQLAKNESTGVQFSENIKPGDCHICSVGKSKKRPHPPLVRPRAETRLAVAHADLWGKHSVPSYGGCQYVTMFTDDMTRMR